MLYVKSGTKIETIVKIYFFLFIYFLNSRTKVEEEEKEETGKNEWKGSAIFRFIFISFSSFDDLMIYTQYCRSLHFA